MAYDRLECHVGVHLGLELKTRVFELYPHLIGPGLGLHEGVYEGHLSPEDPAGVRGQGHPGELTHLYPRGLVLEDVGMDPDPRYVGYGVEVHPRLDVHALDNGFFNDYARSRGVYVERPRDAARLLELFYLVGRHVPELEPPPAKLQQRLPSHLLHPPLEFFRKEELLLRRDELRAVELEENVALPDRGPRGIEVEFLHPAVYLGMEPV